MESYKTSGSLLRQSDASQDIGIGTAAGLVAHSSGLPDDSQETGIGIAAGLVAHSSGLPDDSQETGIGIAAGLVAHFSGSLMPVGRPV
jgi:hypothetical protein